MDMEGARGIARHGALLSQWWRFSLVGVAACGVRAGLVEMLAGWYYPGEGARYILANAAGGLINDGTSLVLVLKVPLIATCPPLAVAVGALSGGGAHFLCFRQEVFKKNLMTTDLQPDSRSQKKAIYATTRLYFDRVLTWDLRGATVTRKRIVHHVW